jgi:hypothetical protein
VKYCSSIRLIYLVHNFNSQALARQLQAEEDAYARQVYARRQHEREEKERLAFQAQSGRGAGVTRRHDKETQEKKDKCIIM